MTTLGGLRITWMVCHNRDLSIFPEGHRVSPQVLLMPYVFYSGLCLTLVIDTGNVLVPSWLGYLCGQRSSIIILFSRDILHAKITVVCLRPYNDCAQEYLEMVVL
jgi:hypothetical protein